MSNPPDPSVPPYDGPRGKPDHVRDAELRDGATWTSNTDRPDSYPRRARRRSRWERFKEWLQDRESSL